MKQLLFLSFIVFMTNTFAQQSITFRLKDGNGKYVQKQSVYRKKYSDQAGISDSSGCVALHDVKSGDTLFMPIPECTEYRYIVPYPVPTAEVELRLSCTFPVLDIPAEYPGGRSSMNKFFAANFNYPQIAIEQAISGKVWVRFTVDTDGSILDPKVTRPLPGCLECDREALRLVKLMPKFIPGQAKGKPVKSYFDMPVIFRLE